MLLLSILGMASHISYFLTMLVLLRVHMHTEGYSVRRTGHHLKKEFAKSADVTMH